ncbi:uncharacterized protein EDB91DRAFT_1256473 [Suillus paluster]|uniref:uncharacterized protein n=1 Tax=Suillus paluster TaxID=48578 RepID=UPI001B8718CF|nr:uncharacterized protein EDB91DRAFT_1256473 [Suillus paluster]KAG1721550.1 hypothetical protein EDB91DRAFT_1256473 [Suillus paluster]
MANSTNHSEPTSDGEVDSTERTPLGPSGAIPTTADARAKRRIAALEDELELMRQERNEAETTYYVTQGRAIRRLVVLYTSLEDLIAENDHWYENRSEASTTAQDRLQHGYIAFSRALPWLHTKLGDLDHEDCENMLKKLKKGADAARGDDTSCLKDLIATWINQDFRPFPLIKPDDKHSHGFVSDVCGKLLCPAEWDWDQTRVKAGICDRTSEYIVSENSWPLFLYENYTSNPANLEEGLLKSKILVLAFKAIFTSPSSVREADGDGNGAPISLRAIGVPGRNQIRPKLKPASPRSSTCKKSCLVRLLTSRVNGQVCFTLSYVSSWRTMDGDFDYEAFWNNIVDFFEDVPGPVATRRMEKLLEWWTRKIFGTNHHEDLTLEVVSQMSVNTLAEQSKALEDAAFDSD